MVPGSTAVLTVFCLPGTASSSVNLPYLNCAAVLHMRMRHGFLHGFVVVGRFNGVVAPQNLFGFAVRTICGVRFAALGTDYLAYVLCQPCAANRFLGPRHVFLNGLLHLFRA